MATTELDRLIDRFLPQVLADRELGDGRTFTRMHLCRLWALSCMHMGECCDETLLATRVSHRLPPQVEIAREVAA